MSQPDTIRTELTLGILCIRPQAFVNIYCCFSFSFLCINLLSYLLQSSNHIIENLKSMTLSFVHLVIPELGFSRIDSTCTIRSCILSYITQFNSFQAHPIFCLDLQCHSRYTSKSFILIGFPFVQSSVTSFAFSLSFHNAQTYYYFLLSKSGFCIECKGNILKEQLHFPFLYFTRKDSFYDTYRCH